MLTPLEQARLYVEGCIIYSCLECKKCVKVGGAYYCEDSGKMLHPMMIQRTSPFRCEKLDRKQKRIRRKRYGT